LTASQNQPNVIPKNYIVITVPDEERFKFLLSDCMLVVCGENLNIYVSPEIFYTLKELSGILSTE
jgi:hypothetical protein